MGLILLVDAHRIGSCNLINIPWVAPKIREGSICQNQWIIVFMIRQLLLVLLPSNETVISIGLHVKHNDSALLSTMYLFPDTQGLLSITPQQNAFSAKSLSTCILKINFYLGRVQIYGTLVTNTKLQSRPMVLCFAYNISSTYRQT